MLRRNGECYLTIKIDRQVFESMSIESVGHACFAPIVPVYQAGMRGKSGKEVAEFRAAFFKSLPPGQRALMFFTWYDHAIGSEDEFQRISQHFLSAGIFGIIKKGAEYFRDDDMLALLSDIEPAFQSGKTGELAALYRKLQEISPKTLNIIGTYIRKNPAAFVCFE